MRSFTAPISRCSSSGCEAIEIGCSASTLRAVTSLAALESGSSPRRSA